MNAKGLILLLAAAAIGAAAAAVTCRSVGSRKVASQASLSDTVYLAHKLGLSPAQEVEIRKLQETLASRLAGACARHCAARAELGRALADVTNGQPRAQALIADMGQAYVESEEATWEHIRQVRALLTPAQQTRYDALISRCVGGTCNMN